MELKAKNFVDKRVEELKKWAKCFKTPPKLAIISVGSDDASKVYMRNKVNMATRVGILTCQFNLDENLSQGQIEKEVIKIVRDVNIDAAIVQLPLPEKFDEERILGLIPEEKDADGFGIISAGSLLLDKKNFGEKFYPRSCTPNGIMNLLEFYDIDLAGKNVVIINRSNIVGKPLALMMLQKDATVTIAHSKTKNLKNLTRNSDVVVTAIGKANYFCDKDFKAGAIVVDVSMNRDEEGKLCGDVCKSVCEVANVTPVPGGVGLTTVLSLIEQTIFLAINRRSMSNHGLFTYIN